MLAYSVGSNHCMVFVHVAAQWHSGCSGVGSNLRVEPTASAGGHQQYRPQPKNWGPISPVKTPMAAVEKLLCYRINLNLIGVLSLYTIGLLSTTAWHRGTAHGDG